MMELYNILAQHAWTCNHVILSKNKLQQSPAGGDEQLKEVFKHMYAATHTYTYTHTHKHRLYHLFTHLCVVCYIDENGIK